MQGSKPAAVKKKSAPRSRKTVSKPIEEEQTDEGDAKIDRVKEHTADVSNREEAAPGPSKSETELGRGEELPAELIAAQSGGDTSEGVAVPRTRRTGMGSRTKKASSKLLEAIEDTVAIKARQNADLEAEGPSKRKSAPKAKKAAKKPVKEEENIKADPAVKGRVRSSKEEEAPAKSKRIPKVGSLLLRHLSLSHLERPVDQFCC